MAGPPKKPSTPVRGRPQIAPTGKGAPAGGGTRDGRTVSLEAGRALQRALDEAPNARVAVKATAASTTTAERAMAAANTVELKIAALPIPNDLVARRLEELRKLISMTLPRVRAPVEAGDEVEVDVLGYIDGKVFMAQQAAWLEVRPNPFLPGLIEGFVGLTAPESAVFQLKMPAHYPVPELRGKVAAFAVTLRQARQRVMPEADDPIFLQLTNRLVKTRAELEAKLRDELAEERGRLCVDEAKVGLLRQLYIKVGVDEEVPAELVDEELRKRWKASIGDAMALQGISMDDQKRSLVEFSTPAMRAEARRTVWEGRCLDAVAEAHGVEATEAEVQKIIAELSPDIRRGDVEAVLYQHAALQKEIVKNLRLNRALLLLLGKAKVTFVSTPPPENRVILAPLPMGGSGGVGSGSGAPMATKAPGGPPRAPGGAPKSPGDMTAARGLKRPPSRS